MAEAQAFLADVSKDAKPVELGDLPITVLSRGKPVEAPPAESETVTLEYLLEERRGWDELQKEIVALSTNSRHIIAEKSDHMIWLHEPELVVSSVEQMVSKLRDKTESNQEVKDTARVQAPL